MAQFLFPSSMLNPRTVDEHFESQADAVDVYALVDMDALMSQNGDVAFRRLQNITEPIVYRGWMLSENEYGALEFALGQRGITLVTQTADYLKAHHLPGWIKTFEDLSPRSVIIPCGDEKNASHVVRSSSLADSGSYIVKDFVKSLKHDWETACFSPNIDTLDDIVSNFLDQRGEALAGNVIVREFEDFTGPESRVWWVNGEPVLVTRHPDDPELTVLPSLDLADIVCAVSALRCPFVTTDIIQHRDGRLRVVEVGDGQVSDFPSGESFESLARSLEAI
jgi:ATP-grasp domain, R2K clade family 3